jgi:hypothetical protein
MFMFTNLSPFSSTKMIVERKKKITTEQDVTCEGPQLLGGLTTIIISMKRHK